MSTLPDGRPAEGSPRWYHRSASPTMHAPSMLRTSASTDRAAATAGYSGVMSAITALGSPCSNRRSDHLIRAGDDPDPMINAAGAPSTVTWQAASRSGFRCLVPDASSNTSCPSTGGRSRTAVTVSSRNQAACVASSGTTRKPSPKATTADADRTGAPSLKRSRSTLRISMSTAPTFQSSAGTAYLLGGRPCDHDKHCATMPSTGAAPKSLTSRERPSLSPPHSTASTIGMTAPRSTQPHPKAPGIFDCGRVGMRLILRRRSRGQRREAGSQKHPLTGRTSLVLS